MPLLREPSACWLMLVPGPLGELVDEHWPIARRESVYQVEARRWELFAANPLRDPPEAWIEDAPCLTVACRTCGLAVGDGEHFADAEHAWAAAGEDGWLGDLCGACQPSQQPVG